MSLAIRGALQKAWAAGWFVQSVYRRSDVFVGLGQEAHMHILHALIEGVERVVPENYRD